MYKDTILKLIEYAKFSEWSNYIEVSFYELFSDESYEELEKSLEELEKYCNNDKLKSFDEYIDMK